MRLVGIRRAVRGRRGLALVTAICVGLGVSGVAAIAATAPNGTVLDYSAYVGGKGKAKGAPITIGFINEQGGPPNLDFPQPTRVIAAGVKMVNAELGGIHGHPNGTTAGAMAMRQAVDAAMRGVPLYSFARKHKELEEALKTWGTA